MEWIFSEIVMRYIQMVFFFFLYLVKLILLVLDFVVFNVDIYVWILVLQIDGNFSWYMIWIEEVFRILLK